MTQENNPPIPPPLLALHTLKAGDWTKAHEVIQGQESRDCSLVHAHLHRVEGDLGNARYWYHRAGEPEHKGSLDIEWKELVERFTVKP